MFRRFAVLTILLALGAPARAQDQSFAAFEAELWPDAQAKGITRATFDLALKGVTPDARVIAATKRQPEYGKPVGAYVNDTVSRGRIANGQRKAAEWAKTFDAVEKKFGVERWVLVALWGMESDYGAEKDRWDVFRSLATLGYVRYRHPYFRNELLVAMRIMQDGHFARDRMVSSWAGAMGQTQFMPTNVIDYAIDFSGDGKSDIWTNVPDVLGSTGNYLHKGNWQHGLRRHLPNCPGVRRWPWYRSVSLQHGGGRPESAKPIYQHLDGEHRARHYEQPDPRSRIRRRPWHETARLPEYQPACHGIWLSRGGNCVLQQQSSHGV